jgi:hypothetical protein
MRKKWHLGNKNGKEGTLDNVPHGKLKDAQIRAILT